MYHYVAVMNSGYQYFTDVLRIGEDGIIEQYRPATKTWTSADYGMGGIYCGAIESEHISEEQLGEIIMQVEELWNKRNSCC